MKQSVTLTLLLCLFVFIANAQQSKENASLIQLIDSLKEADQAAVHIQRADSAQAAFRRAVRSNYPIVKKIFEQYGFPGYDVAGKNGSDSYWMLVQHTDFDVTFQKQVLQSMLPQVKKKNASGASYAFLTDRILINEGKEQLYGTQVNMGPAGTKLKPCSDTTNLDKRRAEFGMESIAAYLKRCDETYLEINKGRVQPVADTSKKANTPR